MYFYPRSPYGERLASWRNEIANSTISIHALLTESDNFGPHFAETVSKFLSTLSLRRATRRIPQAESQSPFLSTLSLRRATSRSQIVPIALTDFYPRSPYGERLQPDPQPRLPPDISIHALLTESDYDYFPGRNRPWYFYPRSPYGERHINNLLMETAEMISIHALLTESDDVLGLCEALTIISIHALLTESDRPAPALSRPRQDFYPRSPYGERLPVRQVLGFGRNFYPRSPYGERRSMPVPYRNAIIISIHALLTESDSYPYVRA